MDATAPAAAPKESGAPVRGALPFQALWLWSAGADLAVLLLPLGAVLAAGLCAHWGGPLADPGPRLALWTVQNVLGSGTHVALTFLLLYSRRDVLTADPAQPQRLMKGGLLLGLVGLLLFLLGSLSSRGHGYATLAIANVFGLHHILSQSKGIWALHGLRAREQGLPPPGSAERTLQLRFVPVCLSLLLARLFLLPDSGAPGATPFADLGQRALLPFPALLLLWGVWLWYFGSLFRTLFREGTPSGPKVLFLFAQAFGVGLTLTAPQLGVLFLPGMHGLEYYLLTHRMLQPQPGEAPLRPLLRAWPMMVLAMLPLIAVGVVNGLFGQTPWGKGLAGDFLTRPFWRLMVTFAFTVTLAHYLADAFIYRLRIPGIRAVMLKRLGFTR